MAWRAQLFLPILALGVLGCGADIIEAASDDLADGADDSGSGSEDEIGDSETGTSTGATSTTDASTSTSASTTDESTSDPSTTDESTSDPSTDESTSETTDTAVDTACTQPISFLLQATDYASITGWVVTMSTLGEGMVLSLPDNVNSAVATFDLDIPCDDTWHIWVRGIEQGELDSYWIQVDDQPANPAVFELDCTMNPVDITYEWRQINWRDPNAAGCQYVQNPWVQNWGVGVHSLELGYRESWAISKIWVSNSNGNPP